MNKNILIIAAHPDDEVLGVGGTIPILINKGYNVSTLIVTDGSSTQYAGNNQILQTKAKEAKEANNLLGINDITRWDFPDMRLDTVEHHLLNKAFESILQEKNIHTVFVQNGTDINMDHQIVFKSLMVAARPHPFQNIKRIYSYFVNSSTEWGNNLFDQSFQPNIYIDISNTIDLKLQAMKIYKSELREYPHPRSIEGIKIRSQVHGLEVGMKYAEPFKLILNTESF